MASSTRPIPRPKAFEPAPPPPELLALFQPQPPALLRVTAVLAGGRQELAIVFKRSYTFDKSGMCRPADEQRPLIEEAAPHDEIALGTPSFKALTEVVGFKTGTDVIVQGNASPPRPSSTMNVAVQIGDRRHVIKVFGSRFCDYVAGKLVFSPAKAFELMPLRFENAYGGRDRPVEASMMAEVERITPAEDLRKSRAVLTELFGGNHPLMYPRNRFGKGYVLEDRSDAIQGRELPNLERPDDLLTPERLIVRHPLQWSQQPIPAGTDFFDPSSFPRSAMLGMPPLCIDSWDEFPEVRRGLLPKGYCRGNLFGTPLDDIESLFHLDATRCASPGLWLPFLKGDEQVIVEGFLPQVPQMNIALPCERPTFQLKHPLANDTSIISELHLLHLSIPERLLFLIWVGRTTLSRQLMLGEDRQLADAVKTEIKRI